MDTWDVNEPNLAAYRRLVDQIGGHFAGLEMEHIPRKKNDDADELAHLASKRSLAPPSVFLDTIHNPSIEPPTKIELANPPTPESAMVALTLEAPDWWVPYIDFLTTKKLPEDQVQARQMVHRASA